jgi:hypothetical protein
MGLTGKLTVSTVTSKCRENTYRIPTRSLRPLRVPGFERGALALLPPSAESTSRVHGPKKLKSHCENESPHPPNSPSAPAVPSPTPHLHLRIIAFPSITRAAARRIRLGEERGMVGVVGA